MRVALPVWNGRVSPVFDVAGRVRVFTVSGGLITGTSEHRLDDRGSVETLSWLGIDVLICSAISRPVEEELTEAGIEVLPEVSGPVEELIEAYLGGTLSEQRFLTPAGARGRAGSTGREPR
jgi:predicted Fe-Mo cluster-binding NifX family protein